MQAGPLIVRILTNVDANDDDPNPDKPDAAAVQAAEQLINVHTKSLGRKLGGALLIPIISSMMGSFLLRPPPLPPPSSASSSPFAVHIPSSSSPVPAGWLGSLLLRADDNDNGSKSETSKSGNTKLGRRLLLYASPFGERTDRA